MIHFLTVILEIFKAVLFGIVEGVTEWLPISSTGHLIILNEFVKLEMSEAFYSMFEVVIQLGAILAVVVLFFQKLNPFSAQKNEQQKTRTWQLWMDEHLYNYVVVALALVAYGFAFIYVERRNAGMTPGIKSVYAIDYRTALLIGAFQCLALIPGTSRSGSTILGGILLGVSRGAAAEFSFFLGIPTMLGASLLKILKFLTSDVAATGLEVVVLLVGCVVSFVVSLLVIQSLMTYVRKHSFSAFGVYRIGLGIVVLVYFLIKAIFAA